MDPTVIHVVGRGDEWSAYLRRMTRRPGWTVLRLAKASGIARSTLYEWMTKGAGAITIESVFRVADALEADRGEALRAAGGLTLERDERVEQVLASNRPDSVKQQIIERIMARRAEAAQREREDVEWMLRQGEVG